jgi:hypothetical protein
VSVGRVVAGVGIRCLGFVVVVSILFFDVRWTE